MKDLHINSDVVCSDGKAGKCFAAIVDPVAENVSHIVVEGAHGEKVMVPIDKIASSSSDEIVLDCTLAEMKNFRNFTETHFVNPSGSPDYAPVIPTWPGGEYVTPYVTPMDMTGMPYEEECVPPGEVAFHRGADVEAADGPIGSVEEFVIDPRNGRISHVVLRKGHLWGQRDITIPMTAVEDFSNDVVKLNLDKAAVDALPSVKVHRMFG